MNAAVPSSCRYRVAAGALILLSAVARIQAALSPTGLELAPDEAHYWDWSRRPAWCYATKGPLVAWLIHLSCSCLGTDVLGVRFPAIACGAGLSAALYVLTTLTFRREDWAALTVAVTSTMPTVAAGSFLMTIDAPLCCLWAWGLVLGHLALVRERRWAWPCLGVILGLGVWTKFTIVLFPACLALLIAQSAYRTRRNIFGWLIATGLMSLFLLPILLWNAEHDWISFRHLGGQGGLGGEPWHPLGPVLFLVGQFAVLLGYWFVAWCAAAYVYRPSRQPRPALDYLWWLSIPIVVFFALMSLRKPGQANWPFPAYLAGLPLGIAWLAREMSRGAWGYQVRVRAGLACALTAGGAVSCLLYDPRPAQVFAASLARLVEPANPYAVRRFDPIARLHGRRELAITVDQCREQLRTMTGLEPVVAAVSWHEPGALAFYCSGHPQTYSLACVHGGRMSHYDIHRPNPIGDADDFLGRPFVLVGAAWPELRQTFAEVSGPIRVSCGIDGTIAAEWEVWLCQGYRGVPDESRLRFRKHW